MSIEQHVAGLDITMHDAFRMCVAQRVSDKRHWRQNLLGSGLIEHIDRWTIDKLQTEEGRIITVRGIMKFKYTNDVRMHQANA